MSTLRVNTLQNTSTTDGGISIDNSGHVTIDGQVLPSAGPLSNRNLIINGAMQVAQRGTSASISDGANEGYRTLDRWITQFSGGAGGVATMSQATEVPNNTFKYSLKVDVTTADTDVATNHAITFQQRLEGQDIENSGWDYTNSDSYLTLSFWARSTKAGTYCCWFYNTGPSANYTIVKEYTLAANTWKHVTLSFPGNSNLNFAVGSNAGLRIGWTLVAGTDRQITADTWQNVSTKYGTSNQVNFFDSTDNVWNLTGVQLEVGSVATPFEHRSYGEELALCQRYYQKSYPTEVTPGTNVSASLGFAGMEGRTGMSGVSSNGEHFRGTKLFPSMRTTPNVTIYDRVGNAGKITGTKYLTADTDNVTGPVQNVCATGFQVKCLNAGDFGGISFHYTADAEL